MKKTQNQRLVLNKINYREGKLMESCKECARLWDKPLPPQSGCNECYDIVRDGVKDLEAKLKVAVDGLKRASWLFENADFGNVDEACDVVNETLEKIKAK